ncbi:MAG: hypothetical protein K2P58_02565 [Hyphomonadaceae bacterium]|nr:hypothetical protein [Hyphomonadaceae bacterium]
MSYWPIYQVGTTVLAPYVLKVEGSARVEVKPFRVLDANDPDLASKLKDIFSSENMKVVHTEVPQDDQGDKEYLSILDASSWEDLYRKCRNWQVFKRDGRFSIERWKSSPRGRGMEPDQEASDRIEKDMPLDRAVAFLVQELRAA